MKISGTRRVYRNLETGELAYLAAGSIGNSGKQRWCAVTLEPAVGSLGRVAGQHPVEWWSTPDLALSGYRKRIRALWAAGFRRLR